MELWKVILVYYQKFYILFNKTTIMKSGKTILSIQFTLSPDYILYPLGRCGLLIINSNRVVFAYLHERHLSLDLQQRCQ